MSKSIGSFAKNLILTTQLSNQEILDAVKKEFPTGKTSMACIAWYKSDLRKKGELEKRGAPKLTVAEKIEALRAQIEALEMQQLVEEETETE
jgi:hypothetical protein